MARVAGAAAPVDRTGDGACDDIAAELDRARTARARQVRDALAPATRAAYAGDWQRFEAWCERAARVDPAVRAFPADDATLSLWVGAQDRLAASTVRRRLAAVRLVHERRGRPLADEALPATLAAIAGHRRVRRDAPVRRATAATDVLIRAMADACDAATPMGLRDRALLLVGWDGGFRRSELVGIDHEHLGRGDPAGLLVRLLRAKGDPTGRGATVPVIARPGSPWCPVAALDAWISASGRHAGPVFVSLHRARHVAAVGTERLSGRAVARITAAAAKRAGLEGVFSGHSLRRGLASAAIEAEVPLERIARHLRHRHIQTTLGYARERDALAAHPRVGLGTGDAAVPDPRVDGAPGSTGSAARLPRPNAVAAAAAAATAAGTIADENAALVDDAESSDAAAGADR